MRLGLPDWISDRYWQRSWDKAQATARGTAAEGYYAAPPPEPGSALDSATLVALDFESDGLGETAALLEAGWVELRHDTIHLATARRERIGAVEALQESAVVIHQITDSAAARGRAEADVLGELLSVLAGRVVLAHCAQIEAAFLNVACQRQFGIPFVGRFICTMELEQRWFPRPRAADGLRLGKLRSGYGLPSYRAHDGLTDAIACAELFLAQRASNQSVAITLRDVLMRG